MLSLQCTVVNKVTCHGVGIHNGRDVSLSIEPAPANHGILFKRSDMSENNIIPALFDNVIDATMCTKIANKHGAEVSTIEHIMAALWGCGVDNALVTVNGPEVPIMDGSSDYFVEMIKKVGIIKQQAARKFLEISYPITVESNGKSITISPSQTLEIDFEIAFGDDAIGSQSYKFTEHEDFEKQIGKARTFGFTNELQYLKSQGLALGASLENAVAIENGKVLNEDGLRYQNEFVRHKILDCIGDLYLAGVRIRGRVSAVKSSHALNNLLLRKIFESSHAHYSIAV